MGSLKKKEYALKRSTQLTLTLALTLSFTTLACEKDEFAGAKSASAPAAAAAPADAAAAGAGTNALPDGHPPVNGEPKRAGPLGQAPAAQAPAAIPAALDGTVGPLRWSAPAGWSFAKPAAGSMRLGEYVVTGESGQEPAVMSIFYFGPQGGGGVEANIERWVGQFTSAEGKPITDAKRETKVVSGMKIHTVDVSGTYGGGMGGGGAKSDYRVLGAIVEAPAGLFFFKLLGPSALLKAQEGGFEQFLQSLKPGA